MMLTEGIPGKALVRFSVRDWKQQGAVLRFRDEPNCPNGLSKDFGRGNIQT
jgi:hypothetical protein